MWSTCNKQTNTLVSAHGLNETVSFFPAGRPSRRAMHALTTGAWFCGYPFTSPQREWVVAAALLCCLPYCPPPLGSAGVWSGEPAGGSSRLMLHLSDMVKEGLVSLPLALPGADVHPNTWYRCVLLIMQPHSIQMLLSCMWYILLQRLRWELSFPSNGSSCTAWGPSYGFLSTSHDSIIGNQSYHLNFWSVSYAMVMASVLLYKQHFNRSVKQQVKSPCFLPELPRAENAQHFRTSPLFQLLCPHLLGESSFESTGLPGVFSCCSPCWLAGGCSERKGRVRKRCWGERRWGEMQQMGSEDVLYTAKHLRI